MTKQPCKGILVGEWDLGGKSYLVLLEDGTYKWYRDGSKNEKYALR